MNISPGVRIEQDKLNRLKFKISIFKGQSLAEPELYHTNKLIMMRLKVSIPGVLDKRFKIPKEWGSVIERIESIDIDFSILEKFLRNKWSQQAVVKLFATMLDVYKTVPPGSYIGEIEMDFQTFRDFIDFMKFLCYKPVENEDIL